MKGRMRIRLTPTAAHPRLLLAMPAADATVVQPTHVDLAIQRKTNARFFEGSPDYGRDAGDGRNEDGEHVSPDR